MRHANFIKSKRQKTGVGERSFATSRGRKKKRRARSWRGEETGAQTTVLQKTSIKKLGGSDKRKRRSALRLWGQRVDKDRNDPVTKRHRKGKKLRVEESTGHQRTCQEGSEKTSNLRAWRRPNGCSVDVITHH